MEAPARPHRRLIWKYAAVVVTLVAAAIVSVGLTELYFSYQDSKRALTRVERDKASSAATSIEQLMQNILRELDGGGPADDRDRGQRDCAERNQDFHRLLDREELVSQLSYLDSTGKEQVRTSPLELDRIGSGIDFSRRAGVPRARGRSTGTSGRVYFQRGSRPHMTIAVAERGARTRRRGGRDRPELRRARSSTGRASERRAMRTPSIHAASSSPIRTSTSSSGIRASPRFRRYEPRSTGPAKASADAATIGHDQNGTKVLSAFQTIEPLGWRVFVEEPLSEAFAPLKAAIWRTALLLVAFLVLAIATSVLLARRLVRPIESIQAAAAKIGSGSLNQRIEIQSNDELGALAEEFNRMAAQLRGVLLRASSRRSRSGPGSSRRH